MSLTQIISCFGSIIFLILIGIAVYREKLQEAYAIVWLLTGCLILAVSASNAILQYLARILGIYTPALAILLVLICGMLFLLFQLTILISIQQKKISRLAEELALLKQKINPDRN